ncbi:formylglycine-generating enzyme family protein [Desulfoluna spongiiphila]|uniref:Sulfatase-modifying factor enzyme 1 n=1 Tax=Desulfoluna spongiiphila TaxID=419481 RepID=A0A1G5CYQ5_9BACT|nr:SUMF1/EgtB/PvdO family nonheme iron enzyme [Desulfoluna spongiiphila]SCY07391.1 Sulfatase-modifying factor enzyme 1 [Desulfoluna spongiiphila]
MTMVRLIPFLLCLLFCPVAFGQGLVVFPFDAPGRPEAEASFFQETLLLHLAPGFRLFEGDGVTAALGLCGEEAASITSCLSFVGEVFEADLGARGRWADTGDKGAFFLEVVDLGSGRVLFSQGDMDGELSSEVRLAALARRARVQVAGEPEATVAVMPGMVFVRIPGEGNEPVYIQASEVTQAQWRTVMGYNPAWFIACGEGCPVESVTRHEIDTFVARMNTMGLGRFRLPTFVEWQRALALSGPETPCLSGNNCVDYEGYPCGAWRQGGPPCDRCGPRPAGTDDNALVNMVGNVWEWLDEPGKGGAPGLIVGGGWADATHDAGLILRPVASSRFAADDVGFRLLLEGDATPGGDTH